MDKKTILITGGAGFVGHALIEHILVTTDWHVISIDRLDYSGNLNRLHDVARHLSPAMQQRLRVIFHDLKAEINPMLASQIGEVHMICHLAASSHVDRSIQDPRSFVMDNVVGTCNMLEYARSLVNLEELLREVLTIDSYSCSQVSKSKRWMPWHLEPKKDVAICDKPRGADKRALIRGCPNGETPLGASCYPVTPA